MSTETQDDGVAALMAAVRAYVYAFHSNPTWGAEEAAVERAAKALVLDAKAEALDHPTQRACVRMECHWCDKRDRYVAQAKAERDALRDSVL